MPHTPSAAKRMRKSEKRRKQNRTVAKALKLNLRGTREVIASGDAKKMTESLVVTQAVLDRAADKGYIHKNKAARLKSRLVKAQRAASTKAPAKS